MESLVSTEWLAQELGASDLAILDATLLLPGDPRNPRAEHAAEHIPGAVFLDLEEVSDTANPIPHMLPSEAKLASRMQALGVRDGQRVVLYDNSPLHSAARAWWMLRLFGVRQVAILDGGLQKWKAEGRPLEGGAPSRRHGHFTPRFRGGRVADKRLLLSLIGTGSHEIVDARGAGRFSGAEPEPRPGMASGHIPGSRNLPQGNLFNPDQSWKRGTALRAAFDAAGVDLSKPMVTTCGSGVTAAVLLFGAHLLGKEDVLLYDGSWSEWGADPETPKETG
ncbi:3-mercaptopyruvate sulfurtransferase [Sphingosinicella sp. BN140058]|uniref:3-mercaptopyruvate sulfurtransferase n=1 Tax=Sphingosinicella sp. BN140058 TaxID=1892855 RepID=UPI001013B604|nr:3-mercaptopyruvate sulfurtransferase [Sphingosinicella sp. BN140058]QAY75790.1 3-mercaptopyruvate sulfurtransferase [Sphingosinicella sp. BN140058]